MSTLSTVTITVPATTANLGPGFDCIGAALTLYNQFTYTPLAPSSSDPLKINVSGVEASQVHTDSSNLAYIAFLKLYESVGQVSPPIEIDINLGIPLARGLGSSATAIVAGLLAGNYLAGSPLSPERVIELAIEMEGHPDNVVPALLGGCRLTVSGNSPHLHSETSIPWTVCEIPWHPDIIPVVAIPDFELSTHTARQVLPTQYSRADAIFNTAHFGLLLPALQTANSDWLRVALQDRIHQPYRQTLIKGYESVERAALNAGAYNLVISGAGPTLLALCPPPQTSSVAEAMETSWRKMGVNPEIRILSLDPQGAFQRISVSDSNPQ